MSLIDTEAKVEKQLYEDFARFMYIACSRVQSEDDIVFKCQDVEKFCRIMSQHVELSNSLGGVSSNSTELSSIEDPVSFLLETEELKNRKPKVIKQASTFTLDYSKLAYKDIYNRLTWNNFKILEKVKLLHISPNTYYAHKSEIEEQIEAYFKSLEEKENVATTGKTLGEIEEEMKETEEKCSETYVLSLIEAAKDEITSKDYEALKGFAKNTKEWSEATVSFVETQIENNKKLFLFWKH